jgi:hypothetical protein
VPRCFTEARLEAGRILGGVTGTEAFGLSLAKIVRSPKLAKMLYEGMLDTNQTRGVINAARAIRLYLVNQGNKGLIRRLNDGKTISPVLNF